MADKKRMVDVHDLWSDIMMLPHNGDVISSEEVEQAIKDAPTVDAVEVVHGRWEFSHTTTVEKFAVVKCSNCGHEAFAIANYVKEGHYCPNCGADMRGEGNG